MEGNNVPFAIFRKRVRDESIGGDNPFKWVDVTTKDIFADRRVLVFALPGAFTPTCSTYQVPGFVEKREAIKACGVDEIYVLSVNDTFVMRKWMIDQDALDKIDFIPDGSAEFTKGMDMVVDLSHLGFGRRSRRYAMVVNDGVIEKMFVEPESTEDDPDPYGVSSPESVLDYLRITECEARIS
jgi:peroxiredoxin